MKFSTVMYTIAAIILIAWVMGVVFKFTSWLLNGLVGVAAIILVIGLIAAYIQNKKAENQD